MTDAITEPRPEFRSFTESTAEDWHSIAGHFFAFAKGLPDRVLAHLKLLDGDFGGFPVDRLTHSLQTATRALRDGRPESYVVMALLHDIGDTLGTYDHPAVAAAILEPFVSEQELWICRNHNDFQGYYYFHHLGMDRDRRDRFRDHPHYAACEEFCRLYDQTAFDPDYDTLPLDAFEPMLRRVMAAPRKPGVSLAEGKQ